MGGEFDFIATIRAGAARASGALRLGIGDDCAVWAPPAGHDQLASTDLLIEGVHFERATTSLADLGHKALAVNLSDIAAMGGTPRYVILGLGMPGDPSAHAELVNGLLRHAAETGVTLIGGDTCASRAGLLISITVLGEVPAGRAIPRGGARPGDAVYVTGTLGDSAAGLALLADAALAPAAPWRDALIGRHRRPAARLEWGRLLGGERLASAMIDVSDGLLADLGHILDESGVGAEVAAERVPMSDALRAFGTAMGRDPLALAVGGGEDYELLFTVPPEREAALARHVAAGELAATAIGRVTGGGGLRVSRDGAAYVPPRAGYEHFS
ncbi:MAG: thiamine-phosphate kinase [Nitrospirae bacterium]|nr:thiamine-phosphate kinase [Nitrospirota bacterium]